MDFSSQIPDQKFYCWILKRLKYKMCYKCHAYKRMQGPSLGTEQCRECYMQSNKLPGDDDVSYADVIS